MSLCGVDGVSKYIDDLFGDFDQPDGPRPTPNALQTSLLERGREAYKGGARRIIFQAPCGAGKTIVCSLQTENALNRNKTVLHIVHRRRLVDQMVKTLSRFNIFASPIMADRQRWNARVMCASRDTLLAMLKSGTQLPTADLLLIDECHAGSDELEKWYLHNFPNSYWTGYTATPVRSEGRSISPPYQKLVCMAKESQLIEMGRLCHVKTYNPDAIGKRRRKGEKVKPVGDPVAHWKKYANGMPTVVFAAKVSESQAICQRYRDAGITAEHLDASTPDVEREAIFARSERGETTVICNVDVMILGVDLPWLVCCQILRGCNSLVLWRQAAGRIMRACEGKYHGIMLDHAGAAHEFGLPDCDYEWELEDAKTLKGKNNPKDRKPVTCIKCGAVFTGKSACPECGHQLPMKKRKSLVGNLHGDAVLTEFNDGQNEHVRTDALTRLWKKIMYIGKAKDWTMGVVASVFSKQAKVPPWEAGLDVPMPDRGEWKMPVREFMESTR
jgi:DNA repair protein RadD